MIYTAWGSDGEANHFLPGELYPSIENDDGKPWELIWTIEADCWLEAINKFDEMKGWAPEHTPEEIAEFKEDPTHP